jgi:iron complex outermembrane recepter protein
MLQRFVKHGWMVALLLVPARAWAQDTSVPAPAADPPPAPDPAKQDPPKKEESVTVRGRAPTPSRGASDFNLRIGELANVPRAEGAAGLLKLAPGILLTNKGGDGHAEQIFLRGFDAREGQDVELTAAGVPINEAGNLHGNGYADLHFIIPELVESLRVIEGPFDPRQGNFAVAGSAGYELGLVRRGLTAKYTTGSFGTRRMLVMWGPGGHTTRTFGGAELFDTDGFGENRGSRRGSAMAQYEGALGKSGTWRVGAQAYTAQFKSAGVVRADDVDRNRVDFYGTYDPRQGGDSSRYSTWADVETKAGDTVLKQQVFVVFRDMRLRENFTGFLLDTQKPTQSPHAQRGDLLDLHVDSTTVGAKGSARFRSKAMDQQQELELGYFARHDRSASTQNRIEAATSVPYATETDLDARLGDIGLYGDVGLRPFVSWLNLRGGVRGDLFTYDVLDNCAQQSVRQPSPANPPGDASCLSQQDFGRFRERFDRRGTSSFAVMPRGSMLVGPFTGFTMSASYGQGVRSIDPIYINQDLATPFASIDAYELGVGYAKGFGDTELMARSVFFRTHVDRDLIFSETAGRALLANGTTRTGWVGAVRATGTWLDQAANVTLVRSTFDDTGLLVPYVPDVVIRDDTAVHHELPWKPKGETLTAALAAGVTFVGRRALPFGQRSDTIFTVDTSLSVAWRSYEIALVATNLLDRRYRLSEFNFASDFQGSAQPTLVPARHFTAGAPRGIFLTLTATLGGT